MPGVGQRSPGSRGMELIRSHVDALVRLIGPFEIYANLQESEQPAKDLLQNDDVADAILSRIADPLSGKGSDELCQWFYESYQTGDPDLQAVVLRYIPTLCGVYFSRTCRDKDEPLAGFEAVLLALYTEEAKARGGRPVMIHLPSLYQPSLYHTTILAAHNSAGQLANKYVEQLNAPLEPQTAVKSTKRASIVGVALDLFYRRIAIMPVKAKLEFCEHSRRWAIQGCLWGPQTDDIANLALLPVETRSGEEKRSQTLDSREEKSLELGNGLASWESPSVSANVFQQPAQQRTAESGKAALIDRSTSDAAFASSAGSLSFNSATSSVENLVDGFSVKLPLPLDLLRPIFKVLGHCLMATASTTDMKEAASSAARALYVRASDDLVPEAILASRSLVRLAAADAASSFLRLESTLTNSQRSEVLVQP